ncbi:MAG: hypothetical protein BWY76_00678 [bacterium ADurb.Bin429]|nr:MAG: hypothetical protein BWY76_00678 [bacterium ADurb.Bin429]
MLIGTGLNGEVAIGAYPLLFEPLLRFRARQTAHRETGDAHALGDPVVLRQDERAGADHHTE